MNVFVDLVFLVKIRLLLIKKPSQFDGLFYGRGIKIRMIKDKIALKVNIMSDLHEH